MKWFLWSVLAALHFTLSAMAQSGGTQRVDAPSKRTPHSFAVDAGGRPIRMLEVGSTLHVGASGLHPDTQYEFRLGFDASVLRSREGAVSFARVSTDSEGEIPPFVLWYESGVVGCSDHEREGMRRPPRSYRTFEEAAVALKDKML